MLRPDDLPSVAAIYAHYVTHTVVTFEVDPPDVAAWHDRSRAVLEQGLPFVVAEWQGQVVGYAYVSPWKPRPAYRGTVEDSIYVSPQRHGHGIGTALLQGLLQACAAAVVREVIAVIVDTGEPGSLALHHRAGFRHVGRLTGVGRKHGRRLDTVVLQRSLAVSPLAP